MSVLTKSQKKVFNYKNVKVYDELCDLTVTIRHDDECGNGHNSFSVTGDVYRAGKPRTDRNFITGGCIHEIIKEHAPDLAHLIKWHLTSTDGPMHYIANTMYLASDKDHNGFRKGEPCSFAQAFKFKGFPITMSGYHSPASGRFIKWAKEQESEGFKLDIESIEHKGNQNGGYQYAPKFKPSGYPAKEWHECPFDSERQAKEWLEALDTHGFEIEVIATEYSEGKEPDLEGARRCAVWPDATLEQLTDKDALTKRLPELLKDFKSDVESIGFVY